MFSNNIQLFNIYSLIMIINYNNSFLIKIVIIQYKIHKSTVNTINLNLSPILFNIKVINILLCYKVILILFQLVNNQSIDIIHT